eukprot:8610837-Pyramimonas_sp.AAC.2
MLTGVNWKISTDERPETPGTRHRASQHSDALRKRGHILTTDQQADLPRLVLARQVLRLAPRPGGKFYSYNEWFIGDSFSLWGTPAPWGTFRASVTGDQPPGPHHALDLRCFPDSMSHIKVVAIADFEAMANKGGAKYLSFQVTTLNLALTTLKSNRIRAPYSSPGCECQGT